MKRIKNFFMVLLVGGLCLFAGCKRQGSDWENGRGRLPNYQTGPGRPLPSYVNFYSTDYHFQSYLLCEYRVEELPYDQSKESAWFQAALKQIRHSGRKQFPPEIKWIAVIILNVAEHKDASSFDQSFKVGAIFDASDVHNSWVGLSQLVAKAKMDRKPFLYDPKQPTPGEQQRWVIVERHATKNK